MRHIVCVVRHAQARYQDVDGVLTEFELTRQGEEQTQRIAVLLEERFGTRDMRIETSGEKRAVDTANRVSDRLRVKPVYEGSYMNLSITPFNKELQHFLSSTEEWRGVHVLIAHFAFIKAAFLLATEEFGFESLTQVPQEFPYGSMVIIDFDAHTVEFSPNDQP